MGEEEHDHRDNHRDKDITGLFTFFQYDTLQQCYDRVEGRNVWSVQGCASESMGRIHKLQTTVLELKELGFEADREISAEACGRPCETGVVVQLILLPYTQLGEYIALSQGWGV
jgi:hypothetical protein